MSKTALFLVLAIVATTAGSAEPILLRVGVTSNGATRVTTMPLEQYVARVLAGEGQPRAADAAQQALAIAVRTFALANVNRHRREGYDLCDTTHCQVIRAATPLATRAAEATAGRVLVYQNQPATIFYSAWCGGRAELASEVWPGAIDYAFEPVPRDRACEDQPAWTSEIATRDLERALRTLGLEGSRLRGLNVVSRNESGRVARLRAEGFSPPDVSAHELRLAIGRIAGPRQLMSTAFDVRRSSRGYTFTGRGYGHGVGLCVVGAGRRAAAGDRAEDILGFYYPGLRIQQIEQLSLTKATRSAPAPALAPARLAPAVVTDPLRRALDDIAAKAGVKSPASIRVTVHPDVAAFGRATGQPWWVSGATDETGIDLVPVALLQQRGVFTRTIRREATHALLDSALAQRPRWVREGAASYFADPSAPYDARRRVTCPTDEELLRPMSAGAHRDALARAEACFRRQLAAGRGWRDVR